MQDFLYALHHDFEEIRPCRERMKRPSQRPAENHEEALPRGRCP